MDKNMHAWALGELDRVYPDPNDLTRQAVISLLSVWSRMNTFTSEKIDRQTALDVFMHLASGKPIPEPSAEPEPERYWVPSSQYPQKGATVRVVLDYDDSLDGWKLNGRIGRIIDARHGDIIMEFTDNLAGAPTGWRGRPSVFEVDISHLRR